MKKDTFLDYLYDEMNRHVGQYLILFTVGVLFVTLINLFHGLRIIQFILIVLFIIFYISWGTAHHLIEKSLTLKTVLEYILIGSIALFLIQTILIK